MNLYFILNVVVGICIYKLIIFIFLMSTKSVLGIFINGLKKENEEMKERIRKIREGEDDED